MTTQSPGETAKLIDAIYEAISLPRTWPDVIGRIAAWLDADMGMMASPPLPGCDPVPLFLYRLDLSPVSHDPEMVMRPEFSMRAIATGAVPGVFRFEDLMSAKERATNCYWQTIMAPLGIGSGLLCMIRTPDDAQRPVVLNYYRRTQSRPFGPTDIALMESLLPHLRRALGVLLDAPPPPAAAENIEEITDVIGAAAFFLGSDARLLRASRAGEALVQAGDGLAIQNGRIVLGDVEAQAELNGALSRVIGDNWSRKVRTGAELLVRRPSGDSPLILVATPLGADNPLSTWAAPVRCVVFALEERLKPDAALSDRIRRLYGLTCAEAEVSIGLAMGMSLRQLAIKRHTKVGTVRSQLKHALAKTRMRKQSDLAGLINRLRF